MDKKEYYQKNKGKFKKAHKKWRIKNREKTNKRNREYYHLNSKKIIQQVKKYQKDNKEKHNAWKKKYNKKPNIKIKNKLRQYANKYLTIFREKGKCKVCKTTEELEIHHKNYDKYTDKKQKQIKKMLNKEKFKEAKEEFDKICKILCINHHKKNG